MLRRITGSIAFRLVAVAFSLTVLITLTASCFHLRNTYDAYIEGVRRHLDYINESHVPSLAESLWVSDKEMIRSQVEGIASIPGIRHVELKDSGGTVLEEAGERIEADVMSRDYELSHAYDDRIISLGTLHVHADLSGAKQAVRDEAVFTLLEEGGKAFALSAAIMLAFHLLVTRHLMKMAAYARGLDISKGFTPMELKRGFPAAGKKDEIHEVSSAFNSTLEALSKYLDELNSANIELENEIVERKQTEKSLMESEERFKIMFEGAPDAIFLADPGSGTITDANAAAERLMQRPKEEIIGLNQSDLHSMDTRDRSKRSFREHVAKQASPSPVEGAIRRADGSEVPVEVLGHMMEIHGKPVIMGIFRDIRERKRNEERMALALKEKELLLREIHHRVKNNMAVVISLLSLQARHTEDGAALEALKESQNRIKSMALIHEKLHSDGDLLRIDFKGYLKSLTDNLFKSYNIGSGNVLVSIDVRDASLDIDTMIPCGLIINELVTNSLKYAYRGVESPELRISFTPGDGNDMVLAVSDNGCGIPSDMDILKGGSLGVQIIRGLVGQMKGDMKIDRSGGTTFTIAFNPRMPKASI